MSHFFRATTPISNVQHPPIPTNVQIGLLAAIKMQLAMNHVGPSREVGGLLLPEPANPLAFTDLYLPLQYVSGGLCEFDPIDINTFYHNLMTSPVYANSPAPVPLWWHDHHSMAPNPSNTDDDTFSDTYGLTPHSLRLITSRSASAPSFNCTMRISTPRLTAPFFSIPVAVLPSLLPSNYPERCITTLPVFGLPPLPLLDNSDAIDLMNADLAAFTARLTTHIRPTPSPRSYSTNFYNSRSNYIPNTYSNCTPADINFQRPLEAPIINSRIFSPLVVRELQDMFDLGAYAHYTNHVPTSRVFLNFYENLHPRDKQLVASCLTRAGYHSPITTIKNLASTPLTKDDRNAESPIPETTPDPTPLRATNLLADSRPDPTDLNPRYNPALPSNFPNPDYTPDSRYDLAD